MANVRNPQRPLSPHLGVWKWGANMLVSIIHRATGSGMAVVGTILLVWWLHALASGEAAYNDFLDLLTVKSGEPNIAGYVLGIGLTLAFFQHMASGVRHFFMDAGANFELKANRTTAILTLLFSIAATAAVWAYLIRGMLNHG